MTAGGPRRRCAPASSGSGSWPSRSRTWSGPAGPTGSWITPAPACWNTSASRPRSRSCPPGPRRSTRTIAKGRSTPGDARSATGRSTTSSIASAAAMGLIAGSSDTPCPSATNRAEWSAGTARAPTSTRDGGPARRSCGSTATCTRGSTSWRPSSRRSRSASRSSEDSAVRPDPGQPGAGTAAGDGARIEHLAHRAGGPAARALPLPPRRAGRGAGRPADAGRGPRGTPGRRRGRGGRLRRRAHPDALRQRRAAV